VNLKNKNALIFGSAALEAACRLAMGKGRR
jgi:hypothetical protein